MLKYLKLRGIEDKDYGKNNNNTPCNYDYSITAVNKEVLSELKNIPQNIFKLSYESSKSYKFPNKLSKLLKIPNKYIRITAGGERALNISTEILLSNNTTTIITIPNFPRISLLAKYRSNSVKFVKVTENLKKLKKVINGTEVIFIANPITPIGKYIKTNEVIEIIKHNISTIFVIDMSLFDFTGSRNIDIQKLIKLKNVIVILSFSKCLGLPGLRIGSFISSNTNILNAFDKLASAYELSSLSLNLCEYLFKKNLSNLNQKSNRLIKQNYDLLRKANFKNITYHDDNCFITSIVSKDKESLHKKLLLNGFKTLDLKNFEGMEHTNGVRITMNSIPINFLKLLK